AAEQEAAQAAVVALRAVLGGEALGGRRDAARRPHAEESDPGPHIDVDAELEAAHPARQHHLGQIDDGGAGDADEKGGPGDALGDGAVAAVAAPGAEAADGGAPRQPREYALLRPGHRHVVSPRSPR